MTASSPRFIRFVATVVVLLLGWLLLTGVLFPGTSEEILKPELYVGVAVAIVVALFSTDFFFTGRVAPFLNPLRWGRFVIFLLAYFWAEIQSNLQVIYLILHPRCPINPSLVRVPVESSNDLSLTGVANGITMTPGTLTVDIDPEQQYLYVHWLNASTLEPRAAADAILGNWAKLLQKVVE